MCGCTQDFPLEISVSPSPLRLLECQNLVVTLPLSCLQTVKVNTENSEEEEYVPQERQPSEANKNNGGEHAESFSFLIFEKEQLQVITYTFVRVFYY